MFIGCSGPHSLAQPPKGESRKRIPLGPQAQRPSSEVAAECGHRGEEGPSWRIRLRWDGPGSDRVPGHWKTKPLSGMGAVYFSATWTTWSMERGRRPSEYVACVRPPLCKNGGVQGMSWGPGKKHKAPLRIFEGDRGGR